ncbi:MAG TPA: DOPA 4,5-dioxygenase family protein [Burkholderiaceae bacterium]|jgi:DOPA 4,5-dioxygenase|nr:DOPA 4,5-dioxygenase family protein [Burkholderiaceae bacterium]
MDDSNAPYHAHVYYGPERRAQAEDLRRRLKQASETREIAHLLFVGQLRDGKVGPHPISQFEIHFRRQALPPLRPVLEASGLTVLLHPLTDDDLADHTRLAQWIGEPIELDLATLDPPGTNQGVARFGRTDF